MTREKKFFVPYLATSNNNINTRWFVFWYEPVPGTNLRKRKKCHGRINSFKTIQERIARANDVISELRANNFYYKDRSDKQPEQSETILHKAIAEKSLRRHAKRFYTTHVRVFLKWLNAKPQSCNVYNAKEFLKHLANKGRSNTTINHYRNTLRTLYAQVVDEGKMKENPFAKIKKLPESRQSQRAFTPAQVERIKQHLMKHDRELWMVCQWIFYCFIRPNELKQLKVKDIDFYNMTITIPGSISKNRKTQTVVIPEPFYADVNMLAKFHPERYIIGNGSEQVGDTNLGERFRKVCSELYFPKGYSLYSFKHTGAMWFAQKTKDVKALQRQLRHHSLDMVNEYLKNMNALDNEVVRFEFPAI